MTTTDPVDSLLRTLDAAPPEPPSPRGEADLDRILATPPVPDRRPARGPRRVLVAGGLVAAGTAALLVLPSPFGGDTAYASWTPAPTGLDAAARASAGDSCRDQLSDGAAPDAASSSVAVAERRGDWTTVVLAGSGGFSALCVSDDSAGLFTNAFFGSAGVPAVPQPAPDGVVATDLGVGSLDAGELSLAAGLAGVDVRSVVYRSTTHGDVVATVSGGHFALWFPGAELRDASRGVDVQVTTNDGSTSTVRLSLT